MTSKMLSSKPFKKQTLAERVADSIEDSIVRGAVRGGDMLPTEPEMAEQFGVSRAVVRDATRMLAAQGLVAAQHGRGVFVTASQGEAFGDALLLALRRAGASVWDVEQFEQSVFPEVCALAALQATDEDIDAMRQAAKLFMEQYEAEISLPLNSDASRLEAARASVMDAYAATMSAIFCASHNEVWMLLAQPLTRLRNLRQWGPEEELTAEIVAKAVALESTYFDIVIDAVASRDPERTRATVSKLMGLPPEAVEAMQQTPVGEIPQIPLLRVADN